MFKPDKRLTRWYQKYNKMYFDNRLPAGVLVGWAVHEHAGQLNTVTFTKEDDGLDMQLAVIRLDPEKHKGARDDRMSLLHEMCHLKLHPWAKHGKKFNNEMRRLAMLGALDDLW